jgi:hypothetical protein
MTHATYARTFNTDSPAFEPQLERFIEEIQAAIRKGDFADYVEAVSRKGKQLTIQIIPSYLPPKARPASKSKSKAKSVR